MTIDDIAARQEQDEQNRLRALRELANDTCSECGRSCGSVSLLAHETRLDAAREIRRNLKAEITRLTAALADAEARTTEAYQEIYDTFDGEIGGSNVCPFCLIPMDKVDGDGNFLHYPGCIVPKVRSALNADTAALVQSPEDGKQEKV